MHNKWILNVKYLKNKCLVLKDLFFVCWKLFFNKHYFFKTARVGEVMKLMKVGQRLG